MFNRYKKYEKESVRSKIIRNKVIFSKTEMHYQWNVNLIQNNPLVIQMY